MNVGNIASSVLANAQEALETVAQTKAEAAKGDQQATRKLATRQGVQSAPQSQPPVTTASNGQEVLDTLA